jgi:hypothetical protein
VVGDGEEPVVERGTVRLQRQQRVAVRLRRLPEEGVVELGYVAEIVVVLERLSQGVVVADRRDYPSIYRVEKNTHLKSSEKSWKRIHRPYRES